MLKVKRVRAVSVALTDSINAVLLQQGDTWEGLCCYVCVTPGAFVGQKVITMDDETHGDGQVGRGSDRDGFARDRQRDVRD
jgi:hypothetical protein